MIIYNEKYFDGKILKQLRPQLDAIHTFVLSDGTILAMFQGNRGTHPALDFKIKILRKGEFERPEPPIHTYWVVDLIIKAQQHPKEVNEILDYYIEFYDSVKPFDSVEERANYKLETVEYISSKFSYIRVPKTLPIDYIAGSIELFSICEKRNHGAYMFRDVLHVLKDYLIGKVDYMHVIKASMPISR